MGIHQRETDVVIVGAGPAGCVLGYLLARSGVDVVLIERERDLQREFRGYFFQPLVVRLFEEMGVLSPLLEEVDHERCHRLHVDVFGRAYPALDYTILSETPRYGLFIEQPPLLRFFIDRARDLDGFRFHSGTAVTDLLHDEGAVTGVRVRHRDKNEERDVRARLVVGADGRHSTVRNRAGIDAGRETTGVDVLWFKLPADAVETAVLGRVDADGVLGYVPLGEEVQVAWLVETGEYPAIRDRGIVWLRDRIARVDPGLADALETHLTGFEQCTLLDPAPGMSETWHADGLVLIGDAAHIANPFGAQGNSLAIQDAVALHPYVVRGARETSGPIPTEQLTAFERLRRPAVETVVNVQAAQTRAVEGYLRYRETLPGPVLKYGMRGIFGAIDRFPALTRRQVRLYAFGPNPIRVATDLFADNAR